MYKFVFTIESISLTIEVIYHITSLSFDQIVKDLSHLFTIYLTTKKTIKKKEKSGHDFYSKQSHKPINAFHTHTQSSECAQMDHFKMLIHQITIRN
jgi:hypothetical protein